MSHDARTCPVCTANEYHRDHEPTRAPALSQGIPAAGGSDRQTGDHRRILRPGVEGASDGQRSGEGSPSRAATGGRPGMRPPGFCCPSDTGGPLTGCAAPASSSQTATNITVAGSAAPPRVVQQISDKDRARFLSGLQLDETTGCLIWNRCKLNDRYGRIWINGMIWLTHRLAWVLAGNEITAEKPRILHNCPAGDNPACCEVSHLWAGTQTENIVDMQCKERGRKGTRGLPRGVSPSLRRFRSEAYVGGRRIGLGSFATVHEAAAAVQKAIEETATQREAQRATGA